MKKRDGRKIPREAMEYMRIQAIKLIKESKKAPGAKPKLAQEERKILVKLIMKPATEFGFIDPLWDCKRISKLIFYKLNKKLDYTNVWRLLQKMGKRSQAMDKRRVAKNTKTPS